MRDSNSPFIEIVQFDGIKVTVEGVKAGVEQLSPIVQSLSSKMKQVADSQGKQGEGIIHIKDTLNSMWIFLQAGKHSSAQTFGLTCLLILTEASKGRQQQLLEEKQRKQRMKQKKSTSHLRPSPLHSYIQNLICTR